MANFIVLPLTGSQRMTPAEQIEYAWKEWAIRSNQSALVNLDDVSVIEDSHYEFSKPENHIGSTVTLRSSGRQLDVWLNGKEIVDMLK